MGSCPARKHNLSYQLLFFEGEKIHTLAAILAASAESERRSVSKGDGATFEDDAAIAK